jgi:hypothetical protein
LLIAKKCGKNRVFLFTKIAFILLVQGEKKQFGLECCAFYSAFARAAAQGLSIKTRIGIWHYLSVRTFL